VARSWPSMVPRPGVRKVTPAYAPRGSDLGHDRSMPDRYCAPGDWVVQVVELSGTPDRHDGTWIRITRYGTWVADLRSVADIERYVALADLEPEGGGLAVAA
jgi:hypothetical protein